MVMYCSCGLALVTDEDVENGRCIYCEAADEVEYCEVCGEELTEDYEFEVGICIKCIDSGM